MIGELLADKNSAAGNPDFYFFPMANKDGVTRGLTRFSAAGYDINRGFTRDYIFNEREEPENYYFIKWLKEQEKNGELPFLAIDLHNDAEGNLHLQNNNENFIKRITALETIMKKETYYTEG
ncbi:MAG TPA: hypothetical protein DC049_12775, partial [Spirochaetia bacterium]|nr:hypothetical protein [Spirochaetia bacterium]